MVTSATILLGRVPSPLGTILVVSDAAERVLALDWEDYTARLERLLHVQRGIAAARLTPARAPAGLAQRLARYFDGELRALDEIDVCWCGTPFQRAVWAALRAIPAGRTLSYGALAERIERPRAVRAVGAANGSNPISLVVPCHRVIGADAKLTGYAGGLERKRWLLDHERRSHGDAEGLLA
jgi:methylated-DNA-[protein]-cysteine S-methyltransferase